MSEKITEETFIKMMNEAATTARAKKFDPKPLPSSWFHDSKNRKQQKNDWGQKGNLF